MYNVHHCNIPDLTPPRPFPSRIAIINWPDKTPTTAMNAITLSISITILSLHMNLPGPLVIFVLQPRRSCSKGSADISCGLRCCWSHSYRYIVQGIPRWNTLEDIRTSHAIVSSWRVQGICQEIPCPVFQIDRKRRSPLNKRCSQIRGNLGHPRLRSVGGQSDWSVRSQSRFRTDCESVEDPKESSQC